MWRPPTSFTPRECSVELREVSFRHSASQPLLFDRLSLRIAPGTKIGLVGRSGGGKTTLTRLLLRFSDVEAGEILVGGQCIARVPQAALRRIIGYVPQDPSMFHRSIADNIRIGRPDATDADVRRAAQLAHAAEFIEALPAGYHTIVGERGVKLSGGQRQRVAIARAILKNAPILILDEATSSLDSESEAAHSGCALDAARRTDRHRHRASALDGPADGRADHSRSRQDRRERRA